MPVAGATSWVRTAKIDARAAAAARIVAVVAPSSAHWVRMRAAVPRISRWIADVSGGCAMVDHGPFGRHRAPTVEDSTNIPRATPTGDLSIRHPRPMRVACFPYLHVATGFH